MTNTTGQERALRDALEAVLNTSGARGEYHSLKYTDAVAEAEKLLADPVSPLDASEAECVREAAAQVMENLAFFTPVEELLHMTKQEMSVRTCREGAKAIRAMPLPHQPATDEGERVRVLDGANSHVFDKRLVIGDGDAFQKGDGGECIAFADEPWASRIATALSTRTSQPPAAETRLRSVLSYIRSELALFAACCAVSNKTSDTFVGTEAKAKEWVACINDALAQSPVETLSARDLFEIARPCFHYAKRGTPDGGMFERSETGRLLMNAMEKIAALTQPEPTAQQATPASRILNSIEEANAWVRGEDTGATVHHVAAQQAAGEAEAVRELIEMLSPDGPKQDGATVFDHTPEEIGLHVMENHEAIRATLSAPTEPVAFASPGQLAQLADKTEEGGTYIPLRKTSVGNFTMALYATPQPTETQRIVDDLRADGWMVAVHNDYRLNGKYHTFWLFTHPNGRWIKGEGETDAQAIAEAASQASGEHLAGDKA